MAMPNSQAYGVLAAARLFAALAIAASTAVYAHQGWLREHMQHMQYMRLSPEDRAALLDARIAAVHAGLKLTPDQEKLWPPVEGAVRDFAKLRSDRIRVSRLHGKGCNGLPSGEGGDTHVPLMRITSLSPARMRPVQ